jgi:hypothetical protein
MNFKRLIKLRLLFLFTIALITLGGINISSEAKNFNDSFQARQKPIQLGWQKKINGGSITILEVDNSGFVYAAGDTSSKIFGGINNNSAANIFITKYNPEGTQLWTRLVDDGNDLFAIDRRSFIEDLKIDSNANVYAVGYTINHKGDIGDFLIKYDSDGNQKWVNYNLGIGNDLKLVIGDDGSLYISGKQYDAYSNSSSFFIAKYGLDGTLILSKALGKEWSDLNVSVTRLQNLSSANNNLYAGYAGSGGAYLAIARYETDSLINISAKKIELPSERNNMPNMAINNQDIYVLAEGYSASSGSSVIYILKLDKDGVQKWYAIDDLGPNNLISSVFTDDSLFTFSSKGNRSRTQYFINNYSLVDGSISWRRVLPMVGKQSRMGITTYDPVYKRIYTGSGNHGGVNQITQIKF